MTKRLFNFLAENDSKDFMFQSMKKICTDSSSDETTPNRRSGLQMQIRTDITDTAYKLPFKYGWKRELVIKNCQGNANETFYNNVILF